MLKVLGSMLILLASVGFGFQIQMDLRNHLRLLYDIRKLLLDIVNETAYTMDPMEVVLEHAIHSRNFMSVNLIFKIAAVGILVTVLSQVLKHSGREEHAFLTSLAGLIIVLFWIVPYIYELFETMQSLFTL